MDNAISSTQGQVTAQASSPLDDKLKAFNAYLDAKYPDQASNALRPPFIEAAAWPIRRADFGIDDSHPWNDDLTLTIIAQPYADMQVGDMVKLFWDGVPAGTKALEQAQIGKPLIFRSKSEKVPAGDGKLLLKVMRSTDGKAYQALHTSIAVTTVAWFECPGDQDEDDAQEEQDGEESVIQCKLDAPSVQLPADGIVDEARAGQGVQVTVAPYSYMGQYDTIRLSWGSQMIERLVQADEVDKPIVIEISEEVIRAAGTSDPLAVQYSVVDEVGNASRAWSAQAQVKVELGGGFLQATYAVERSGGATQGAAAVHAPATGPAPKPEVPLVSDTTLDDYGDSSIDPDLAAFYVTVPLAAGLQPGDKVYIFAESVFADGEPFLEQVSRTVPDPAEDMVFRFMGNEWLKPVEGGWLEISYTIERNAKVVKDSASVKVLVGDVLETLPAPRTEVALQDENLDPALQVFKAGVYITIPTLADLTPPYSLRLFWETTAGSHYESEQSIAAGERPGSFRVPQSELALGDTPPTYATVYYMVYQDGKPNRASEDLEFTIGTPEDSVDLDDYLDEEASGTELIDGLLRDYDAYLKQKNPNEAPASVPRPYVFDAKHPGASADFGIGKQLLEDYDDQVLVLVKAWEPMVAGDTVQLFWEGKLVAFAKVLPGQEGRYLTLAVQGKDVPSGLSSMHCQVRRKGGETERSGAVSTLVLLDPPGVEGEQGIGQALAAPLVAVPSSGFIGQYDVYGGVKVTVPAYLNMRAGDLIYLFWGDARIVHTVLPTQVRKPVDISVDKATVEKAGDSNELPVYYFVADETGNESEWSQDASVKVNLLHGTLLRPEVLVDGVMVGWTSVVDRGALGAQPLRIQAQDNGFQVGDSVLLHWIGTTEQGQEIPLDLGPAKVTQQGQTLEFRLSGDKLELPNRARLYYTLTRNGVSSDSRRRFITLTGAPLRLPAPTLKGVEDDWVDADMNSLTARVPSAANLQLNDVVTLRFVGTTSAGAQVIETKTRIITRLLVGGVLAIPLKVDIYLKPFDGGFVRISYEVRRGNQIFRSDVAKWYVGYLAETLPAPFPSKPLPNNTLDPSLDDYKTEMKIALPKAVEPLAPCRITLYWSTSGDAFDSEDIELKVGEQAPVIPIPREHYDVEEDDVVVYYVVNFDDKPSRASEDLSFRIATAKSQRELLPEPVVAQAAGGQLSIFDVADKGLQIKVPQYPGMAVGDQIVITFGDHVSKPWPVSTVGEQTIALPGSVVVDNARPNTEVSYQVIPAGGSQAQDSRVLSLTFDGGGALELFGKLPAGGWAKDDKHPTPTMRVECLGECLTVKAADAGWPDAQVNDKLYFREPKRMKPNRPAYQLVLNEPAKKLRLSMKGSVRVEAYDTQGKRVAEAQERHEDKHYLTLTPGAGQRIRTVRFFSLGGSLGKSKFGRPPFILAAVLMVH